MDYEFQIKLHEREREFAHLREMRELTRGRIATNEENITEIWNVLRTTSEAIEEAACTSARIPELVAGYG